MQRSENVIAALGWPLAHKTIKINYEDRDKTRQVLPFICESLQALQFQGICSA